MILGDGVGIVSNLQRKRATAKEEGWREHIPQSPIGIGVARYIKRTFP